MKKQLFTLILMTLTVVCNSQSFENYVKVSEYKGDLNDDGQIDKIVVYEKPCNGLKSKEIDDGKCRRIAIYLNQIGNYILFAFNDRIISCSDCDGSIGDAFRDIKVENSSFSIENLYGGCDKTFEVITFKYNENLKDFYLHKICTEDYSCREAENLDGEIKITEVVKRESDFGVISFEEYNF